MVVHVGINGFGRIGRIIFRKCFEHSDIEVSAINDPAVDIDYICYLIKFDSTHGRFPSNLMLTTDEIIIDGAKIKVFHEKLPSNIPWQTAGVQYVVEASGLFTNYEKASGHLTSDGVKRVIVTAPSVDIPMLILGVNEDKITTEHKVISCASSTLYCLAPLIRVLVDNYGIAEGFITSIHAMTPSLKPLDGLCLRGKHWRDHRSILQNIIPAATGACKALGRIIPEVKNKMTGLAFRVPIVNVSVLDVTIRLNTNTTIEDIINCIEDASQTTMKDIISTSGEDVVSSDFLGDSNSCILDKNSSLQLTPNFFKLICWYENEYSYACRVADSILYTEKCFILDNELNIRNKQSTSNRSFLETTISLGDEEIFNKTPLLSMCKDNNFMKIFQIPQSRIHKCGQSNTSGDERKNDIFEIWNDDKHDKEPKAKENKHCTNCQNTNTSQNETPCVAKDNKLAKADKVNPGMVTPNNNNVTNKSFGQNRLRFSKDTTINSIENIKGICRISPMSGDHVSYKSRLYTNSSESSKTVKDGQNFLSKTLHKLDSNVVESKSDIEEINKPLIERIILDKNLNLDIGNIEKKSDITYNDLEYHELSTGDNEIKNKSNVVHTSDLTKIIHIKEPKNSNNGQQTTGFDEGTLKTPGSTSCINDQNCQRQSENTEILNMKKHLQKKILEGTVKLFSPDTILIENELPSLQVVNNITNNGDRLCNVPDIYDKLDSVSGTDSENSFQIKEKKSQVLKITDLTKSLEDLARLDKICKIIEISDELSDKLFSVLDNDNNTNFNGKNWSFKDLCKRLKLDEFYNNVFEHSKS